MLQRQIARVVQKSKKLAHAQARHDEVQAFVEANITTNNEFALEDPTAVFTRTK
jgi:hypothetical protein